MPSNISLPQSFLIAKIAFLTFIHHFKTFEVRRIFHRSGVKLLHSTTFQNFGPINMISCTSVR